MNEQEPTFIGRSLFKGHDTRFGIFYTTNFIIAVFDSYETAKRASEIMLSAGYSEDEVDAVPSEYIIADIEKGTKNATLIKRVQQRITRHFGSDATFWADDLKWARGSSRCTAQRSTKRIVSLDCWRPISRCPCGVTSDSLSKI